MEGRTPWPAPTEPQTLPRPSPCRFPRTRASGASLPVVEDRLRLQLDFHPLSRRAHLGIIIPRFLHHLVDDGVGVFGIVVKQDELFRAAFHDYVDGLAPVAVSPTMAARFLFFGQILCVVDEHVGACG